MKKLILTSCLCILFVAGTALADWDLGDPYKMHYPQLPDPWGWDVYAEWPKVLADDWRCTETGPVSDVHLWGSWRQDMWGTIDSIHLSIHDNIPAGADGADYSQPGDLLWDQWVTDFTVIDIWEMVGDQGWYNPNTGDYAWPDHMMLHQINIVDIVEPFTQEEGGIYWLDISVVLSSESDPNADWGWKTSLDHWQDDAVWSDDGVNWTPLYDPLMPSESLDMAFVITPEPATIALLGLGALGLIRGRRRQGK